MVLCAVNADHTVIKLLEAPATASPGDRVTFPPFPADSVAATPAQMVKKKILEGLAAGVSAKLVYMYDHVVLLSTLILIKCCTHICICLPSVLASNGRGWCGSLGELALHYW